MLKTKAIELLGGSIATTAAEIGVSYQAVDKWPDELPARIADRVLAALARKHLPPELLGGTEQGTSTIEPPSGFGALDDEAVGEGA